MRNVNRKAILISCPGSGSSFLPGPATDLENFKEFLQSDKGGRWYANEITTLPNPTFDQLFDVVHSTKADYNFIYFSGHGYTTDEFKRMVALRDSNIEDLFFINDSRRQLIIIDACRNYIGTGISGTLDLGEQWEHFDGVYEAREIFDRHIKNSPHGKTIVHATQVGQYSYDSQTGGYFTKTLLHVSTRIKTETYRPIFISQILPVLPKVLKKQGNAQIPEITYIEGNMKVPFTIAVPKMIFPKPKIPQKKYATVTVDNSAGGGLLLFGLVLLLIAASSK